ncbi:MAG: radical SAM protein [Ardenticatenaceae bacterium]
MSWRFTEFSFLRSPDSRTLELAEGDVICYGPYHKPTVLNESALSLLSFFEEANGPCAVPDRWRGAWGDGVIERALEDMLGAGLLLPEGHGLPELIETPKTLAAWLHVTDRCNLRCDYCYLPHLRKDMSFETGRKAIEATFRSAVKHGFSGVKFKYAGGEALIRFGLVVELHGYAQALAERYGLALDGVVLSNGTLLTPQIVQTMQGLGLRLMISLDGLGEFHDVQRKYAGGRGSFEDVSRGVDVALDYGLVPDVSITVSGRNAEGLADVVAWVLARDLPFSLNFYRENELSSSLADLKLDEEKIIQGMLAAYKVMEENLPRRSLLASIVDRSNLAAPHLRTCGVGHSYLVFDYRGRVSKCQMQLHQPVTTVQADDPLALIRADSLGIQNLSVEEKEGCRDCEWKYWCTGGCSLATFRATGRYDIKSPNCNIYKALYPEAVRLEGLRLLKYATQSAEVS